MRILRLLKKIADYFIGNKEAEDFSASRISHKVHVSESSLSRFAKKCGFSGYREFSYRYKESLNRKEVDEKIRS